MTQPMSLTVDEAARRMNLVDEQLAQVRDLVNRNRDTAITMTSGAWQGNQARVFDGDMSDINDRLDHVVATVSRHVETARHHMNEFITEDSA
jgi:hypothetical protein